MKMLVKVSYSSKWIINCIFSSVAPYNWPKWPINCGKNSIASVAICHFHPYLIFVGKDKAPSGGSARVLVSPVGSES
jgi:hypothetical protein